MTISKNETIVKAVWHNKDMYKNIDVFWILMWPFDFI